MNETNNTTIGFCIPGKPNYFGMRREGLDLFRPQKDPLILLDEVVECNLDDKHLIGIKHVRPTDPYVQAHFPADPCMPPIFVIEALAQACGALMNLVFFHSRGIRLYETRIVDFWTLEQPPYNVLAESKVKQFNLAFPGEDITLSAKITLQRKEVIAFHGRASVGDRLISDGELILAYPTYTPIVNADAQQPELSHASR